MFHDFIVSNFFYYFICQHRRLLFYDDATSNIQFLGVDIFIVCEELILGDIILLGNAVERIAGNDFVDRILLAAGAEQIRHFIFGMKIRQVRVGRFDIHLFQEANRFHFGVIAFLCILLCNILQSLLRRLSILHSADLFAVYIDGGRLDFQVAHVSQTL